MIIIIPLHVPYTNYNTSMVKITIQVHVSTNWSVFKLFVYVNWGYQEFFVVFVYSDGLKLVPHGYMRKGGTAGTSELLYPNCVGGGHNSLGMFVYS